MSKYLAPAPARIAEAIQWIDDEIAIRVAAGIDRGPATPSTEHDLFTREFVVAAIVEAHAVQAEQEASDRTTLSGIAASPRNLAAILRRWGRQMAADTNLTTDHQAFDRAEASMNALIDPEVSDALAATVGDEEDAVLYATGCHPGDPNRPFSAPHPAKATFAIRTADPGFNCAEPVLVNGYLYTPTKEA